MDIQQIIETLDLKPHPEGGFYREAYPPVLGLFAEGVYHLYDYQFFYRNLQDNVKIRINAFVENKN